MASPTRELQNIRSGIVRLVELAATAATAALAERRMHQYITEEDLYTPFAAWTNGSR